MLFNAVVQLNVRFKIWININMQMLRNKLESLLPEALRFATQLDILAQFKKEHRRQKNNNKKTSKSFHDETLLEETAQDCVATVFHNTV